MKIKITPKDVKYLIRLGYIPTNQELRFMKINEIKNKYL